MKVAEADTRISLRNILFLTDFSAPSEVALPFAAAIARRYGAKVYSLHAFEPDPLVYTTPELAIAAMEAAEENAQVAMLQVESQFSGLPHETILERGLGVWDAVQQSIREHEIDLIVLGTHGRTGAEKLLLGSVAEEIFRRSPVPVLTIGPGVRKGTHSGGWFHRVLFATDFTTASLAAAPYAVSLAQENQARLLLVHVMRPPEQKSKKEEQRFELSVAEVIHQLYETVPKTLELSIPPEIGVEYGEPAVRILDAAKRRAADLIVLGVRSAAGRIGAATHLEHATAHKVVAHAGCPVLTIRDKDGVAERK
jgi:nucleotide-binding universal stress UspA family protein